MIIVSRGTAPPHLRLTRFARRPWKLARDEHLAVRFLLPQAPENAEAVARFTREAPAAIKIKSHHVARLS